MARKKKPSGRKIGKPRSIRTLGRIRGTRKPGKVVVIVCEGRNTEPLYLHAIRLRLRIHSLSIRIIPDQGAPISIVDKAIEEKMCLSRGDEVWCVFDVEEINYNKTFNNAVDKARRAGINLAITNPAFEYWYLLHFERTDRPFRNADMVERELKKYLPLYDKSTSIYDDIEERTSDAVENACLLRSNAVCNWNRFPNSSTGVDRLVQLILSL